MPSRLPSKTSPAETSSRAGICAGPRFFAALLCGQYASAILVEKKGGEARGDEPQQADSDGGVLGISASAILVRFSQAPSGVLAVYRLGWTVLLLLPVVLLRYRAELKRVTRRDVLLCAASGVCLAVHFLAWFESLRLTSVSVSTVLVSTEVIFTALGFDLFLRGRIPRLGVAAILLAFGGSAVLALSGGAEAGALSGNLLALAAAVASALYTLIGRCSGAICPPRCTPSSPIWPALSPWWC